MGEKLRVSSCPAHYQLNRQSVLCIFSHCNLLISQIQTPLTTLPKKKGRIRTSLDTYLCSAPLAYVLKREVLLKCTKFISIIFKTQEKQVVYGVSIKV